MCVCVFVVIVNTASIKKELRKKLVFFLVQLRKERAIVEWTSGTERKKGFSSFKNVQDPLFLVAYIYFCILSVI